MDHSGRAERDDGRADDGGRFAPGDVVVRREILRGEVWFGCPTICVEDTPDLLVLYLPPGAEFGFPEAGGFPCGRHPWQVAGHRAWSGHGKLMLHRPGEAHSVDVFWTGPRRAFAGWYFNLQEPLRRTPIGVDTLDHELDLWWGAGTDHYVWKDVELFAQRLEEGRYPGLADTIRAEGDRIAALLDAGERWWDEAWSTWRPDPAWPVPALPSGWDTVPPPR
ncbi:DUF402 domain-containing protein [Micromonospora sp. DSM 115977]|uniref:DUF402 domain-containing protein n=1 Tax=Micromonospora reichwaldensis TaxID=3075516 RepID=A0ABU2X3L0_9ACTN|nr:DUF402 domain-containing protein [Micromonospora sp. DSM 115977]MDT0532788.1 DUF402 domain-containing protein [Micromonospora sp. DSM 115977]